MSFARSTATAARAATKVAAPAKRNLSLLAKAAPRSVALNNAVRAAGVRGVKTLDFAGTKEVVYERADWPNSKLQE